MKSKNTFYLIFLVFGLSSLISCDFSKYIKAEEKFDFETTFEKSNGSKTATYQEVITFYQNLAQQFPSVSIREMGFSDSGKPLHLVVFNPTAVFTPKAFQEKLVMLVNNGIHPGETDGIDASMMFFRDLAQNKIDSPKNTIIATIPIYNVGGALNRNKYSRTNQNGPEAYGFRGNAKNYDLNRDFIKADSQNAMGFTKIFHYLKPAVFLDNHVTNGANYQYTLTHLITQEQKLDGPLGTFLADEFQKEIKKRLLLKNWEVTPYVNVFGKSPEQGFDQFLDLPRYSVGYASLFNTLGITVETHMLKDYKKRVSATYDYMLSCLEISEDYHQQIKELKARNTAFHQNKKWHKTNFKLDKSNSSTLSFKGFKSYIQKSEVTGLDQLYYDDSQPYTKEIPFYNYYIAKDSIRVPKAYLIPQAWQGVIARLKANELILEPAQKDTLLEVTAYRVKDFKTLSKPFEGHYLHYETKIQKEKILKQVRKGDIWVPARQPGINYILETLEPTAPDSFFNWNFFDSVLQQKEHFSPYVFDQTAAELLRENPTLKRAFEAKKATDPNFKENAYQQLDWLHKQSKHYEKAHLLYPIFRLE